MSKSTTPTLAKKPGGSQILSDYPSSLGNAFERAYNAACDKEAFLEIAKVFFSDLNIEIEMPLEENIVMEGDKILWAGGSGIVVGTMHTKDPLGRTRIVWAWTNGGTTFNYIPCDNLTTPDGRVVTGYKRNPKLG